MVGKVLLSESFGVGLSSFPLPANRKAEVKDEEALKGAHQVPPSEVRAVFRSSAVPPALWVSLLVKARPSGETPEFLGCI